MHRKDQVQQYPSVGPWQHCNLHDDMVGFIVFATEECLVCFTCLGERHGLLFLLSIPSKLDTRHSATLNVIALETHTGLCMK